MLHCEAYAIPCSGGRRSGRASSFSIFMCIIGDPTRTTMCLYSFVHAAFLICNSLPIQPPKEFNPTLSNQSLLGMANFQIESPPPSSTFM